MTDQTPDAAREANGFGGYSRADVEDACRAADLVLAHPLTRNVGGPYIVLSTKDAATLVSAARAAVSRARDAAWREGIVEALAKVPRFRMVRQVKSATGYSVQMTHHDERKHKNEPKCIYGPDVAAALDALLARMDTTGGANE